MSCISLKRLTFMFVIACVVWCSSIGTYIARKGNYRKGRSKWNPPHKTTPKPKAPTHSIPPPSIGLKSLTCDALEPRAFQDAWSDACKVERSTVLVPPKFTFLVGPVSFSGANCQPNIVFQLDGIIIAPTDFQCWGNGSLPWLEFTYLRGGVTVQGKGILDGRGSRWWKDDGKEPKIPLNTSFQQIPPIQDRNEFSGNMPRKKPTVRTTSKNHEKPNFFHDYAWDAVL
ncbi:polygalacturonase At1g48100-like [Gossypium hirsutum]|uniref:Polygalacturonase At1g48100-like n=1 Tax=Gossypium hirsutum TaxID=3635 RepID=A0ABM3BIP1_GOSHI|nr:polygalacturonase At1g48100-like [Gossypium hirsutum]